MGFRGNIDTFFTFNFVRGGDIVSPTYLSHRKSETRAKYNSAIINSITYNRVANKILDFLYANKTDILTLDQKQTILNQLSVNPRFTTQSEIDAGFEQIIGSKFMLNMPPEYIDGAPGSGVFSLQRLLDESIINVEDRVVSVIMNPLERFIMSFMAQNDWGKTGETVNRTTFRNWISNGSHQNRSIYKSSKQYNLLDYNGTTVGEWWCLDYIKKHLDIDFLKYYDQPTTNIVSWETILKHNRKKLEFAANNLNYHDASTIAILEGQYPEDFALYDTVKRATGFRLGV